MLFLLYESTANLADLPFIDVVSGYVPIVVEQILRSHQSEKGGSIISISKRELLLVPPTYQLEGLGKLTSVDLLMLQNPTPDYYG